MRRVLRSAVAILGCLVATSQTLQSATQSSAVENPRIEELLDKGEKALLEGEHKEAIRAYSAALKLSDNRSTTALYGLGTTYLQQSKFRKAQECAEEFLEAGKTVAEQAAAENLIGAVYLGRALESQSTGQRREYLADAESHLRASLATSSGEMSIAWLNLSVALQEQDRLAAARDAQQEYVDRTPENSAAKGRLCALNYLAGSTLEESPTPDMLETLEEKLANMSGVGLTVQDDAVRETPNAPERSGQYPGTYPMKVGGSVLPPEKIHSPAPPFTKAARNRRIQGVVVLEAVIDEEGKVRDITVLRGLSGGLTESAVDTAKTWKFKPATKNGEPVPVYFSLTVRFSLQDIEQTPEEADVQVNGSLLRPDGEDVQPPVELWAPSPRYTEAARKARVQGEVVLEAIIDEEGDVTSVRVLKGLPMGLSQEAALAVCRFQFKPATRNGEPVAVIYNFKTSYRLEK